ncbi:MAG: insulinase family protein [Deltaproteobacteria bacterium]|nr:insulinase family protein [Deltaproteobacteria bacterium]
MLDAPTLASLNADRPEPARVTHVDGHDAGGARIDRYRLGNGLEVIVWEDRTAPVFSYQTWFRVGSRHDPVGRTGIAHLFEHLMFKATKHHPEGDYDRLMEARGGQNNAATWVDWTYYKAKLPRWELPFVVALEADRMEHLALAGDMLEREREVVKNERLMRVDNDPDGLLSERLYRTAFTVHPYGAPTIGWMEDIQAISLADCERFYRSHYAPDNALVVVVGDVAAAEVLRLVQDRYGHLPPGARDPEPTTVEPPQDAERRLELSLPIAAPRLVLAYKSSAAGSPDHAALEVACELLVGGDSSRLHRRLVEELELATDVSGWVSGWAHPGVFELSVTLRPEVDPAAAERVVDEVVAALARGPIDEREIDKAKNGLEAAFWRGQADVGSRARALGHGWATLSDWRELWSGQARLLAVSAEDVRRAAGETLVADRRTVAIARPSGAAVSDDGDEVGDGNGDDDDDGAEVVA